MITIPRPSMSVNAPDVFPHYNLENNRVVAVNVTPYWLANNISFVAANATNKQLKALVFNCHGIVTEEKKFLGMGIGTDVRYNDLKHFRQIRGLVKNILLEVCNAAGGEAGKRFCRELARVTQANVFASENLQQCYVSEWNAVADGDVVSDFEGTLYRFGKSGETTQINNSDVVIV